MDLTDAEDMKKRWQEYTEELYKKHLHEPDNHNGVITHLESDILDLVDHNKLWKILQENWRYQGNISCKEEHNKRQIVWT